MIKFLKHPTLKQYVYIFLTYAIIAHTIAYFVLKKSYFNIALLLSCAFFIYIIILVRMQKIRDRFSLKFNTWILVFFWLFIFFFVMFENILTRRSFVEEPYKLKQTTIVVPVTYHATSSGKARHFKYLYAEEVKKVFHCLEDFYDACMDIYQYHGKMATIYYQRHTKVDNLIYEIVVDGQRIYQFEQQLSAFKAQRKAENIAVLWLLFLYFLPAIYFIKQHHRVVHSIPEMNNDEKLDYDNQRYKNQQLKNHLFLYTIDKVEFHQLSNALKRYYIIAKLFIFMAMITFFAIGVYLGVFLLSSILTARWLIAMILLCLVTPSFYIVIKCLQALTQKKSI